MRISIKELLYGALLTALALLIPLVFKGWLQVAIPPFSATLGSHVPSMLAMTISPWVAALVGFGSSLGFLITLGPDIAARAAIHIVFGVIGATFYRKGFKLWQVLLLVLPIHAAGEALVVMLLTGFNWYQSLVLTGIGTALHHIADSVLTITLFATLVKAGLPLNKPGSKV